MTLSVPDHRELAPEARGVLAASPMRILVLAPFLTLAACVSVGPAVSVATAPRGKNQRLEVIVADGP